MGQEIGLKSVCIGFEMYDQPVFKKREYEFLKDVSKIEKDANLVLLSPDPDASDNMEAIKANKWKKIVIIYEEIGSELSVSDGINEWLKNIVEEKDLSYHLEYQTTVHVSYKNVGFFQKSYRTV